MATGKKSFVLYCDLINAIDHLTTLEKGKLFEHLLDYVNDKNPVLDDRVLLGSWKHIEQSLKRDLIKYEKRAERSRENGALGGRPKKPKKPSGLIQNPEEPKKPDSDSVSVTDSVNVIFKEEFYNSFTFLEAQAKSKKTTIDCINRLKVVFWEGSYEGQEEPKSLNDLKTHFSNWLKYQELDRIKPTVIKHWNES